VTNLYYLDDLAELGARTARAPRGLILKRENATNNVTVVGRYGTLFETSSVNVFPAFIYPDADFISIPEVRAEPRLIGHALLDYVPRINSLIVARISPEMNSHSRYTYTLFICNSDPQTFESGEALGAITHVVNVCRQFVSALGHTDTNLAHAISRPLPPLMPSATVRDEQKRSEKSVYAEAASYLMSTLPRKQILHETTYGSFVSLRTWKKTIMAEQIVALDQTMLDPSDVFLDSVASEVALSVQKLFGAMTIQNVVPLPKAGPLKGLSLAELLSRRVAVKLGATFTNALTCDSVNTLPQGQKLKEAPPNMSFSAVKAGGVLLLDDLAKSAAQIGEAQILVRQSGATCFAMSWLSPA
jgi:hypothetical protein